MKILIPIKRVPDPYTRVKALADGSGIDRAGMKYVVNPFDEIAVEEAVRTREKTPAEIVVTTIGGPECEEQLRAALAMGADRAVHVLSEGPSDSRVVAHLLAAVAHRETPDVVMMGKQAIDDDNNQTGQMLAALLDIPQATFISRLELKGATAICGRETDIGIETVELPLPAVITVDLRLNEPRYVALPGIIKARTKPLERVTAIDLGVSVECRVTTVRVENPPARKAGRRVANVAELVQALRHEAKVI